MTVNVNNFTGYAIDSQAVDPDLAVFLLNTTQYMLEAPVVNAALAVFALNSSVYEVTGRLSARLGLENTKMYELIGNNTTHISTPRLIAYVISGGNGGNQRPAMAGTKLYMITA